jgi:hypothetical protein
MIDAQGFTDLDEMRRYLTDDEWAELQSALQAELRNRVFFPNPGPQLAAASSEADIIGYGGAAGGGKSYLVVGLSATEHKRSAIIRPQKNQTSKFVEELTKMLGSRDGYSSQTSAWKFNAQGGERYVKFFGLDNPGDEEKQQGEDFDLKAYDEVTQMREKDVRYTLTWNRTDDPAQRVRALLTFNPPTTPEGRWVIKFFAPWLDPNHSNPAKEGELRWFATVGDEQDFEVAGPQPFIIKHGADGKAMPWYSFRPSEHRPEEIIRPKSRTFIKARVTDNPYYMATGYLSQLQSLPEPLRSQMMNGDFQAGIEDDAHQVIPTAWIEAAQERWKERAQDFRSRPALKGPMDSLGVDVARGGNMGSTLGATGNDELVLSPRHGTFFDQQLMFKGVAIDDGAKTAGLVIAALRDNAVVHLDVVGVGTSPYDFLNQNNIQTVPVNGAAAAAGTDQSGLLRFTNLRAELHWRMREALDPLNPSPIALPPDPQLLGDLAAPRWWISKTGITIEGKDEIKKRLGRSPDRGEGAIYANMMTPKRLMVPGGYANLPAHLQGSSYEERRLKEIEG